MEVSFMFHSISVAVFQILVKVQVHIHSVIFLARFTASFFLRYHSFFSAVFFALSLYASNTNVYSFYNNELIK